MGLLKEEKIQNEIKEAAEREVRRRVAKELSETGIPGTENPDMGIPMTGKKKAMLAAGSVILYVVGILTGRQLL